MYIEYEKLLTVCKSVYNRFFEFILEHGYYVNDSSIELVFDNEDMFRDIIKSEVIFYLESNSISANDEKTIKIINEVYDYILDNCNFDSLNEELFREQLKNGKFKRDYNDNLIMDCL